MEPVLFKFESPAEYYEAEVFVLWCFDWRFDRLLDKFKARFRQPDYIKWAGGAKALADGGADREAVLNQIRLSVRLHRPRKVVLMAHADCGAYGEFKNPDDEFAHHSAELERAAEAILREPDLAHMEIESYFADFSGLRRTR